MALRKITSFLSILKKKSLPLHNKFMYLCMLFIQIFIDIFHEKHYKNKNKSQLKDQRITNSYKMLRPVLINS